MSPQAIVISIITALALIALIGWARKRRRAQDRLASQWTRVEGEVLDVWQSGMGSYYVRYRFTPRGSERPITRDESGGCLKAVLPEVGARVPVRYDPETPERARLQREGC